MRASPRNVHQRSTTCPTPMVCVSSASSPPPVHSRRAQPAYAHRPRSNDRDEKRRLYLVDWACWFTSGIVKLGGWCGLNSLPQDSYAQGLGRHLHPLTLDAKSNHQSAQVSGQPVVVKIGGLLVPRHVGCRVPFLPFFQNTLHPRHVAKEHLKGEKIFRLQRVRHVQ